MRKRWKFALAGLALLLLASLGFLLWASAEAAPMPEAVAMLSSSESVAVQKGDWLAFEPFGWDGRAGFIFYPGGKVAPEAYAPAAHRIAESGILVVIVPMPLNLAVLDPNRADAVVAAYPQVEHWTIGGHSLGGAMAAQYAHNHPQAVQGLVLWAAYPAGNSDLSGRDIPVLSIAGSLDVLASAEEIRAARQLLPPEAKVISLEGGNHAQFGWYGEQAGDLPALITRQEQQEMVIAMTIAFLGENR